MYLGEKQKAETKTSIKYTLNYKRLADELVEKGWITQNDLCKT